jgi:D-tyrosyl-tRNA(Tyr) deacylase
VGEARVNVAGRVVGEIGRGLLVLAGISVNDESPVLAAMAEKIVHLRIFPDPEGESQFHRTAFEESAELLVVSQFTLYADCRKGRRPSFVEAAPPGPANALFEEFVQRLRETGLRAETGEFGASMDVALVNQGPVTIWLDSDEMSRSRKGSA